MADLLKRLLGTGAPWTSLTYWGLALLIAAPELLSAVGHFELEPAADMAGKILMVVGIRRRLG